MSDAKNLADAILFLPKEAHASCLALLGETTLGKLLKSKVTELVKGTDGEFAQHLEQRAKGLEQNSRAELALRMFSVMNKTLELEPRHYAGRRDFEDNAEDIVARCLAVMRKKEKDFSGNDLGALVRYQTNKMFGEIGKSFDGLPDQKKSELLNEIRRFIQELPADQREKLKEELGANEITDDYLKKALISGALGAAFAATVEIGGFPFYIAAVKLVAWVTALIGITLPFAFYTTLTSLIAVLANPLFLIPLLGGGGHYFYKKNNRSMQQRFVPLIVTQLTVTFLTSDGQSADQDASQEALRLWSEARVKVAQYRKQLEELEDELTRARQRLKGIKKKIKTKKNEKAQVIDRKAGEMKSLASMASTFTWPARLADKKTKLEQKARDLLRIQQGHIIQAARVLVAMPPRWWMFLLGRPDKSAEWLLSRPAVSAANREIQRAAFDLAEQAVQLWLSGERGFDERAAAILKKLDALEGEISTLDGKLGSLKKERAASESEIARLSNLQLKKSTAKTEAEDRFWGLERLP